MALVLVGGGCTDTRTTLVVVSVQGAAEGYESMRVGATLDGKPGTEVKDIRGDQRRFGIRLPEVVKESELLVQIEAQREDCVAGRGSGRVRIGPAETRELVVPLAALKTRLCHCSNVGWCWENPLPQGNTLNAVWAFSERDVWAVGGLGTIFHYDGTAWRSSPSGSVANLFALWGGDHDDLWAVGEQGVVLRYDGRSWTQVENPLRETQVQFRAVFGFAEGDVWIGGDAGTLLRAPGHGALVVESSGARTAIRGIWGASAEDIWLIGDGGLLRRRNGPGWAALPGWTESRDLNAIWGTSQQDLWVGGDGGLMIHIFDGMRTTETLASGVAIRDLFGSGAGAGAEDPDLWAVGVSAGTGSGVVLRRRNGPWSEMRVEEPERPGALFGVHGSGSSSVWAVGQHGTILRWQGDQAQVVGTRSTNRDLLSVWASGPDDVWAVGGSVTQPESGAALLHFDGQVWSADPVERSLPLLRAVYGSGPKDVWAVGNRATVLHYNGQGWSAERVSGLTRANLRAIWVGEGSTVWVVGEGGTVLRRQAGPGGRWEALPTEPRYSLHAVWGVGAGTEAEGLWIGGADPVQRGVLLARRGGAWVPVQGGAFTGIEAITGSGPADIWALTRRSPLLHYDGTGWQPVETNVVRWLEGLWAFGPEEAWAVGQDGYILFWNGKTWVRTISGASNDLHGIWGSGRYNLWAVGNGGTILRQRL